MDLSDETKSALVQMIADTPVSRERAEELYREKARELRERGAGDGDVSKFALPMVQSDLNEYSSVPSETESIRALVIGHSGYRGWNDDDFEDTSIAAQYGVDSGKCPVLVANAILYPEGADPALGAIIFRATEHDETPSGTTLEEIRSELTPLSTVEGEFTFEVSSDVHDYQFYIANSTSSTDLRTTDVEIELDERRAEIDRFVDREIDIANVANEISETDRYGFAGALGAEMVRVEGVIADYYLDPDRGIGTYVLQDNSMPDFRELDEEVQGDGRTPGLTCWMETEQMVYDTDSVVTVYGSLSKSRNTGQISLNAVGIASIYAEETTLAPSTGSSGSGSGTDSGSSRRSTRSGQVQETTI